MQFSALKPLFRGYEETYPSSSYVAMEALDEPFFCCYGGPPAGPPGSTALRFLNPR